MTATTTTYDATSTDPRQRVMQAMGAARNIKRMMTVNPDKYDTPTFRATLADMVFMARLMNQQAVREKRS